MIRRLNPEIYEQRKRLVTDYLEENEFATAGQLKAILELPRSTSTLFISRLRNLGIIYRTGAERSPRYWLNKEKYQAHIKAKEDAEIERLNNRKRKAAFKVNELDTLIFLSKKRPSGTNTIFEECKQNSAMLLPVLRTMAARRVA